MRFAIAVRQEQDKTETRTASAKIFSTDTFATCGFNFRMRKYAQCGPRLNIDLAAG